MAKFPVSFFLRWWWRMPPRTPYISILHTHGITISFYDSFPYDEAMKPSCCKWRRTSWSWFCAQGNRHCLDACRLTTRAPTCQPATGQWAWAAEPPAAAAAAASTGWVLIAQAFRIGPGKAAAHGIQQPLETGATRNISWSALGKDQTKVEKERPCLPSSCVRPQPCSAHGSFSWMSRVLTGSRLVAFVIDYGWNTSFPYRNALHRKQ